eukprot:15480311-Alexandrium_andersonii.AAC.1
MGGRRPSTIFPSSTRGSAQRALECRAVFLQNLRTVLIFGLVRPEDSCAPALRMTPSPVSPISGQ